MATALNDDALFRIFSLLPPDARAADVCQQWCRVAADPLLPRRLLGYANLNDPRRIDGQVVIFEKAVDVCWTVEENTAAGIVLVEVYGRACGTRLRTVECRQAFPYLRCVGTARLASIECVGVEDERRDALLTGETSVVHDGVTMHHVFKAGRIVYESQTRDPDEMWRSLLDAD
jgi:hypothetical protein